MHLRRSGSPRDKEAKDIKAVGKLLTPLAAPLVNYLLSIIEENESISNFLEKGDRLFYENALKTTKCYLLNIPDLSLDDIQKSNFSDQYPAAFIQSCNHQSENKFFYFYKNKQSG